MDSYVDKLLKLSRAGKDCALNNLYIFELINEYGEYKDDLGMRYHEIIRLTRVLFNRLHDCKEILNEATYLPADLYDLPLRFCRVTLNILKIFHRKFPENFSHKAFDDELNNLIVFYDKLFKKYLED